MKWNAKFNYPKSTRSIINGSRHYCIGEYQLPSVSHILEATKPQKDKEALKKWKIQVGEIEAARISHDSTSRGNLMHKTIEKFLLNKLSDKLLEEENLAEKMAFEIIEHGLRNSLSEIYGCEATLYYPKRYGGTCDTVGVYDGSETIIDYKNSIRPKKIEWIRSYLLQCAGYAMAHNKVYNSNITKGVILMCSTDLTFQKFVVEGDEFLELQDEFMKRVELYYKMKSKN